MTDIKRMNVREFRELGYLHEINRLVLHPLGLALEVEIDEHGEERLGGVWDFRDDPEGIYYGDPDLEGSLLNAGKVQHIAEEIERRGPARIAALGFVIEPLPPEIKQLKVSVLEPTLSVGPVGELDEGEERP